MSRTHKGKQYYSMWCKMTGWIVPSYDYLPARVHTCLMLGSTCRQVLGLDCVVSVRLPVQWLCYFSVDGFAAFVGFQVGFSRDAQSAWQHRLPNIKVKIMILGEIGHSRLRVTLWRQQVKRWRPYKWRTKCRYMSILIFSGLSIRIYAWAPRHLSAIHMTSRATMTPAFDGWLVVFVIYYLSTCVYTVFGLDN